MLPQDVKTLLRNNSVFWSKLGFCYDPPQLDNRGKPIVFFENFERFAKYHRDFAAAGVKVHTSILFSGWIGVNQYDYELTDKVLEAVFKDNPGIYYIPRIKLNVPIEWGRENPEELFVYYEGPRETEAIRRLVGTEKQDILGYESPKGYYTAGGWQDERPNVGGLIANQSFSSGKWLADAGEALRRVVAHLEGGPYKDRIVAYHIAYGACGETCLWGRVGMRGERLGDYGVGNRREFYRWGLRVYGSREALRKAWGAPDLTIETAMPPTPVQRGYGKAGVADLKSFFRAEHFDLICADYDRFMSEANVNAIEHFGKIVKEYTDGKLVGTFYGYFLECHNAAYTGWLAYEKILNSPYVDFIAAPKSYYRSNPGEPGGELGPAQSVNLRKLWMDELDNRTHLCATAERSCQNMGESLTVMRRELSKNLAHNSGFWWMDLGGGWYDSPEILREVTALEKDAALVRGQPGHSISEVLLVCDEEAIFHTLCNNNFHDALMRDIVREAMLCGTPVDMYRLKDLETIDLSRYKFIIFLNTFKFDKGQWERIEKCLSETASLLWHYAPGILSPAFALDNIELLTGVAVLERSTVEHPVLIPEPGSPLENTAPMYPHDRENFKADFPLLAIAEKEGVHVLARYQDGAAAAALSTLNGRRVIYSTLPFFKPEQLRVLMEMAGCHFYAPLNCAVYGDNRFIGIFPASDVEGKLCFKEESEWIDTDGSRLRGKTFPLDMKAKTFKFLRAVL